MSLSDHHPTIHELRQQHRRSLAAPNDLPSQILASAIKFWCHCQGLDDQDVELPAAHGASPPTTDLVDWLTAHGWPAQVLHTRIHHMGDFVWIHDEHGARFVVCQGEQPGLRIAYWDPRDGEYHWQPLVDLDTGIGTHRDLIVRPRASPQLQGPAPARRRGFNPMSWLMKVLAWRSRQGE